MDAVSPRWQIAPCPPELADKLAAETGLQRTTAEVLIRRGHTTAEAARSFIENDGPRHDPMLLGDMQAACDRLERAVREGERICVHGDYDADGICATALAVTVLSELGAAVEWHLPSRFDEGYGVGVQALERLATDGVKLVLTVDCGITAVEQVARADELGMDVIVTDHHRPGDVLPDCTLVCTRPSEYPFPELCGTGVVFKLAQALLARMDGDVAALDRHLDLVALGTVADVVPLTDENRGLVRAGLRRLARTERPGLRALMASAGVDRTGVRASDIGFRLAPRINAAGRLRHPGAALELLLTGDEQRARELAEQLEALNRERQGIEDAIVTDAIQQVDAADPEWQERRAYVLASRDWHEGVIGIVASRLAERYSRPVVLIAITDEGAKGSGRSIAGYDLHGGLTACRRHLSRFGGHRAAAGLSIEPELIEAFARDLAAHADGALSSFDLRPSQRIDAILAPAEVSLELADELARLEPFGLGNPGVTLLAPAATLREVSVMGEGRHLRAAVELGGFRCRAVGFGQGQEAGRLRAAGRFDVAYRLQRNEWNGSVSPQMVLRSVVPVIDQPLPASCADPAVPGGDGPTAGYVDERGRGVQVATVTRLIAAGEQVLVLVADAERRAGALTGVLHPGRFGHGGVAMAEYAEATDRAVGFRHVVALDPPADPDQRSALDAVAEHSRVYLAWGAAEIEFARQVAEARAPLRPALTAVWRARRDGAPSPGLPERTVAACLAVLSELGIDPTRPAAGKVDLERSPTYRAALERVERSRQFLLEVHAVGLGSPRAA